MYEDLEHDSDEDLRKAKRVGDSAGAFPPNPTAPNPKSERRRAWKEYFDRLDKPWLSSDNEEIWERR